MNSYMILERLVLEMVRGISNNTLSLYENIQKRLMFQILQEVSRKHINSAVDTIVTASGGQLEKQKLNRVRNVGGMKEEEFINLIKKELKPEGGRVTPLDPVKGRTPTDYESGFYKSYSFTPEGESEAITLILTDPKRKQSNREKQEHSIIDTINSISGEKTIVAKNEVTISNVKRASKSAQKGEGYRQQPYADIDLYIKGKDAPVKISAKGTSAPSLGGAGLTGVVALNDKKLLTFVRKFYNKVLQLAKQGDTGDKYIEIPKEYVVKLFRGNKFIGGPIDYYYRGDLDVVSSVKDQTIKLNGNLIPIKTYATSKPYYFRITRRRVGGGITDKVRPGLNIPIIYVDDHGKANSRLLVADTVPANATKVEL